jgi:uncharacterized membrane protein YfcA
MMSVTENWWMLLVIGVLSGVLSGTFGVGAGIIMIPALVFLAVPQKDAQAVALAVMVPMALLGAWRYHRNPEIHLNLGMAAWIALGSVAGVLLGTHFAGVLTGTVLRRLFALVMVGVAVRMWFTK